LKKLFFLILFIATLLAVDGSLTYDIFDYRVGTLSKILAVFIVIFIFVCIGWADSSQKREDKNTSE
jgi:preprotein translocase subunit SecG